MDPAVGLAVLLLEVGPERFQLLESDQRDLSPWVDERGTWFYVKPDKLFCCVVGKTEGNPVGGAEAAVSRGFMISISLIKKYVI